MCSEKTKLQTTQAGGRIPETHMLFVGEEFYCFGACDEKRALLFEKERQP